MFGRALLLRSVLVVLVCFSFAGAAETSAPLTAWVPGDSLIVLEVLRPKEFIDRAFSEGVVKSVTALPPYQEQMAKPEMQQFVNLLKYFQGRYNMDLRTLLGKVAGGGILLAAGPQESALLIIESEDAKMLEEIHEFFLVIAKGEAQKQADPERVKSAEYRGVTGWRFAPNEAHAIVDKRLIVTNKPELLKAVLDLRAKEGPACIADVPAYQAAATAAGPECAARVFANLGVLKEAPQLKEALTKNDNPLGTLLFAPVLSALRQATWIAGGAKIEGNTVRVEFAANGAATDPAAADGFAWPQQAGEGALANIVVPRQIAGISLFRDLHRFYAAKDLLFPDRTSGLIFFENMMGIFFTGRDLTEEVLAETQPDVRVVVAEQKYDERVGTPTVQLPSFAVVFRMRNPEKFAPVAEEAWQKALGLINFTRGQQAQSGLIIDRPTHAGTKYTMASFSAADVIDRSAADIRFNFQPAVAMPGDYLILSSSDALTKDLIDGLTQEKASGAKSLGATHSLVEVNGTSLASILKANREGLIRQNMVEEGNSRQQAESQMDLALSLLGRVRRVELRAETAEAISKLVAQFELDLP